jgi:hypothetical protein
MAAGQGSKSVGESEKKPAARSVQFLSTRCNPGEHRDASQSEALQAQAHEFASAPLIPGPSPSWEKEAHFPC